MLALEDRFAPASQAELYRMQMRERRQIAGETFSELGQDIQRLANMAYPTVTFEFRESLAREHFVDALDYSEMRICIKESRPRSLKDAVILAVELDAHQRTDRKHYARHVDVDPSAEKLVEMVKTLSAKIESLQTDLRDLQIQRSQDNARDSVSASKHKVCYFCRKPGHLQRDCVMRKRNKSKQLNRRCRSNTDTHTVKGESPDREENAGRHDATQAQSAYKIDVAENLSTAEGSGIY